MPKKFDLLESFRFNTPYPYYNESKDRGDKEHERRTKTN